MPTPRSKQSGAEGTGKLGTFDQTWAISDISKLYHGGNGIVTYVGSSSLQEEDISIVRSINPIPVGSSVMVTIIDPGKKCYIAVGFCQRDYPENLLPGWGRVSIGFHADSGNIFINGSDGLPFGQPCATNDCIECGLLPSDSETSVVVVFRHNGRELGTRELRVPVGGFHAVVGMMTPGEKVHLCIVDANPEPYAVHSSQSSSMPATVVTKGATKQVLCQANMEYDKREMLFKSTTGASNPGFVMFCPPLSERLCYFEVEVVHLEQDGDLVIGLGSDHYSKNTLPGMDKNSVGLQCSNGYVKCDGITALSTVPVHTGDVIGYVVDAKHKFDCNQSPNKPQRIPLTFYKNAKQIAVTTTCEFNNSLYPIVGAMGNNVQFKAHYTLGRKPLDYFIHYKLPEGYMNITIEREIDPHWIVSPGQSVVNDVFSIVNVCQSYTAVYKVPMTISNHYYTVTLTKRNDEFAEFSVGLAVFSASADDISMAPVLGSVQFCPLVGLVKKDNKTVYNFIPNVCHSLVKSNYFGVGIDPRSRTPDHIDVFFTSDDQEIDRITIACTNNEALYPMIVSKCASSDEAFHVMNPSPWPPLLQLGEPWGISRLSPRCTAVCNCLVQYSGDSNTEQVGTIQAAFPMTRHHRYFEFKVYRRGYCSNPCIGIGVAVRDYALDCQPGWLDQSLAYHLDDGNIFHNSSHTHVGPLCSNDGDQFGCGLVFSVNHSSHHALVFFTKNSRLIACWCARIPSSGFFPTIGLHTAGALIDVDLNAALLADVPPYPYEWKAVRGVKAIGNTLILTSNSGSVQFAPTTQVQYLRIRAPSKKEAVSIMLGYKSVANNTSSTSQVCVKIPKDEVIFNQSVIARLLLDSMAVDYIGCGIEQSRSSHGTKVFITANDFLIYSFYTSELGIEDITAMVEINAQPGYSKEIDAHTLWPPISAIGRGWAIVSNLCLHHNNNISYSMSGEGTFGFAQAAQSLSADCLYFEVEILRRSKSSNIAVGLTSIYYSEWPGSRPVSVAYYASTGCVHCSSEKPTKRVCKLCAGDVIGCGVREIYGSLEHFTEESSREYEICFTLNGQVVYARDATDLFHPSLLYPTFALESGEDEVIVRLNVQCPSFSIGREWGYFARVARAGYLYEHTASADMKMVEPGVLQAAEPLTKQHCFFSLSIISCIRCVSIGVCPRLTPHSTSSFGAGGIMYSSSGQLSVYTHCGARRTMSLERCSVGDTMTCGIEYAGSFPSLIKFFHNDAMTSSQKIPSTIAHGPLYATFSLDQPGDVIRIDLDTEEPALSYDDDVIGWLRTSNVLIKNGIIMYASKLKAKRLPIGFAQVAQVVDGQSLSYYEVELLQTGQKCQISVGLATPNYSIEAHPGWYAESIAFHGDDGRLFNGVGMGALFCHPWRQGDVVGIGIRNLCTSQKAEVKHSCCFPEGEEAQVFFTRNGTEIGCTTTEVPFAQFYPTIGMHSFGECVKVDLKAAPPSVHGAQRSQWRMLSGVKITSATDLTTTLEYDHPMYQSTSGIVTIAIAVSAKPFSSGHRYVEMIIHSLGTLNAVIIGAVEKKHPLDKAPGWAPNSIAYHSDDGKLYQNSLQGSAFGPICRPGDVMGIKYHCSGTSNCTMVFTQNGAEVGYEQISLPQSGFFPAVGMASPGDKISVKFQETFSPLHPMPPGILSPMRISNIMFSGHVLTYNKQQSNGALGMAVFAKPLGENFKGFSINLINQANNVYVGIASRDYSLCTAPGKKPFSCAYCTSSGLVYECLNNTGNLKTHPATQLATGDTLGCQIEGHDEDQHLLFTQNRKKLLTVTFGKSLKTIPLYPVVAVDNTERGDNTLAVTCLYVDSNPHNYMPLNYF